MVFYLFPHNNLARQLQWEMIFQNGNLEGPSKKYSQDGKLSIEASYKNNQFDGLVKAVYEIAEFLLSANFHHPGYL